ncbi:MAG: hypothetical protein ACE5K3_09705 [bacterium]
MPVWSVKSKHIKRFVLVLPGFNQGRGKRGAWFAWTEKTEDFFRGFSRSYHTVKYEIFEPESKHPLSDGELQHLAEKISSQENAYSNLLHFEETLGGMGRSLRNQGIRGLILYLMMVLSVKQFWIIILLWPQTLLANFVNFLRLRIAGRTRKVVSSFWQRGKDPDIIGALNEAKHIYRSLELDPSRAEPLRKYQCLRDYFKRRRGDETDSEKARAYELVEEAYRDIIAQLTGDSLLLKIVPQGTRERIINFFHITEQFPYPDNIFGVRNLYRSLSLSSSVSQSKIVGRNERVEPSSLEMFLLCTKSGERIVIPCPRESVLSLIFRAETFENIQRRNLPLEAVLYVGSQEEREVLLGFSSMSPKQFNPERMEETGMRIQNALLDTFRQEDSLLSYYLRELPSVYGKWRWRHPLSLWGNLVHLGFPWLFISHGIPAFAIVACTWIFWDSLWVSQAGVRWQNYFQNLLEGVDKAYHNVNLRVMVHSGLGDVNATIVSDGPEGYRDALERIEEYHFPRKFRDMVLLNSIATETPQLRDFQREANDFTTLPIPTFCYDEAKRKINPLGEILK